MVAPELDSSNLSAQIDLILFRPNVLTAAKGRVSFRKVYRRPLRAAVKRHVSEIWTMAEDAVRVESDNDGCPKM
jgi:hypothetical protein